MTQEELEIRLREIEQWAARLDGQMSTKWEGQDRTNVSMQHRLDNLYAIVDSKFAAVFSKLTRLETKVALFSALAAGAGSLVARYLLP